MSDLRGVSVLMVISTDSERKKKKKQVREKPQTPGREWAALSVPEVTGREFEKQGKGQAPHREQSAKPVGL